jgi:uncharacterized membrane protein YdjX (TVP38/TMEM64 family)
MKRRVSSTVWFSRQCWLERSCWPLFIAISSRLLAWKTQSNALDPGRRSYSAYALAKVLFVPGSAFSLAGGALFGPLWGTIWNLTGATIGASLAFLIARYLAHDWVPKKAASASVESCAG